ncbi:uncharacterized protein M421DRAFT_68458 [Didymella exigua CBS 183.55]|uniref:Homeobox domain-containing protein n=1 Tax=Didymella exigua CBS 183.55 TaxID=1150837 RepID=A0A6A5RFJ7_9PLEO|nr:uncharacterized protein M421DRAFT_68458 [Didymella exigua CBS 183.55]KAF1926070.1 hypothetical protein M421DRAFT_68458 [Didymella exigua CBS 183.55]
MHKSGGRFSKEVVRMLKNWLNTHKARPYPTNEEMELLQRRTGLNKTQISNWFANARRRGKLPRAPSSHSSTNASNKPVDIAPRPDTPAPRREMRYLNPMERWQSSPPEHEPAAASDITRALESNEGVSLLNDGQYSFDYRDNAAQSWYNTSSASSAATSVSSDVSGASKRSMPSRPTEPVASSRPLRKRRINKQRARVQRTSLIGSLLPYQCTFCTEDFKTKHDWQRHEKSLHLPIEQWVCTLHGPEALKLDTGRMCCVFCGEPEPDEAHLATHNYQPCRERTLEERTFNRKDHLNQHLQLVHNMRFDKWSMSSWKVPMSNITTRCGFCGHKMDTWEERVDHLAAHYKEGITMACWQGDWGLDDRHLGLLENAIPPCECPSDQSLRHADSSTTDLIDLERSTPAPFVASQTPYGSPTTAYELIKIELDHSMQTHFDLSGRMPGNPSMQLEACRIIFASEVTSTKHDVPPASWLRDLIMACQPITNEAKFGPLRLRNECRFSALKINGQDNIFELCPLEAQLWTFVKTKEANDVAVTDENIQEEASKIVAHMEQISNTPSDVFANWLIKLIHEDTRWLQRFRVRACSAQCGPAPGLEPQLSGLSFAYTSAPIERPLPLRMETNIIGLERLNSSQMETFPPPTETEAPDLHVSPGTYQLAKGLNTPKDEANLFPPIRSRTFINSANFFSWLVRDLARWVAATMSPNNPNCHVPTDEELQHQARCIVYDDDDPWNQTSADNAQWLRQFKRDVGILDEPNDPNESNLSGLYNMRNAL